jgi:hypothetical protein
MPDVYARQRIKNTALNSLIETDRMNGDDEMSITIGMVAEKLDRRCISLWGRKNHLYVQTVRPEFADDDTPAAYMPDSNLEMLESHDTGDTWQPITRNTQPLFDL